jgi:flagellar biosynthesis chaperone FliJ
MVEYPLEQLQQIKQNQFDQAVKRLEEAKERLHKAEEALQKAISERDEVVQLKEAKLEQLRETIDAGTTAPKIREMKDFLKIVVQEKLQAKQAIVDTRQKEVDDAARAVRKATDEMMQKKKDLEKLGLHRQEWTKAQKKEEERDAGHEQDEQGSISFTRRQKEMKKRQPPKDEH